MRTLKAISLTLTTLVIILSIYLQDIILGMAGCSLFISATIFLFLENESGNKDIIDLARENEQLKKEAHNLTGVVLYEIQYRGTKNSKVWPYFTTPMHREHNFDYIITQIRELLEENEKLKENQNS